MLSFITNSPAETHALAKRIGAALRPGTCVAFFGGLGAGKTTFTRGLAEGLGLPDLVSSPTFALVNEYHAAGRVSVYHFDMYRVTSPEALETILRNRMEISAGLKKLGFEFITLDLEGFRSGCYDKKEE